MKVFIASSGDLKQERKDLKLMLYDEGFTPILWESIDQSITENKFQDRINEEHLTTCDIVILIVKSRLGQYTMEEFEVAYKNLGTKIQRIYVYFFAVDVHILDKKDRDNIFALKDYLKENGKLYQTVENLNKLKLHFLEQKKYFKDSNEPSLKVAIVKGMPKYTNNNIFGRDDDLKNLKKMLKENNHLAIINGFGGIGKTTLASKYFLETQDIYDNMFWMEFSNSLEDTFINFHLNLFGETSDLSKEEIVSKVLEKINNTQGDNLLVIDNVEDNKNTELIERVNSNFKLLLTSRKVFDHVETLELKILSKEASKEIFKKYYKRIIDENTLDAIISKTGGHALTVELLAKASYKNKRKTLEDILNHMLEVNFDLSKVLNGNFDESLVAEQLVKTFEDDLNNLGYREKLILKNLSILTPREFKEVKFLTWLGIEEEYDKEEYDKCEYALDYLVKIGLIKRVSLSEITMHQVISEVVKKVLSLKYENCVTLIVNISNEIAHDSYKSFTEYMEYKSDVENIVNLREFKDIKEKTIAYVYTHLATLHHHMGELEKALGCQKKALELYEEILEDKDPDLATSYSNISVIYINMGELEKALEYQKKALELDKETLEDKHPALARSYNNISVIYINMGELEKALEYQKKALELMEEVLGDEHPELAQSYNNISMIYKNMGELKKALEYQKKALELYKEILGEKHPDLAISYNNISMIYYAMGELEKALEYQKKALELKEEILGDKHPSLAITYLNIAQMYFTFSNIDDAKEYVDKSIKILSELFPNGHSHLDNAYKVQQSIYSKIDN